MWKLHAKLILNLLQATFVLSTGEITDVAAPSASNEPSTNDILPLILLLVPRALFSRPTFITELSWIGDAKLLAGGTKFSTSTKFDKQIFTCGLGSMKKRYSKYGIQHDDSYCTYWTSFKNGEQLTCKFEPEPFVEKVNVARKQKKEQLDLSCGPKKRGKMYRFVYKACMMTLPIPNSNILESNFNILLFNTITKRDLFEVYRFCYIEEDKEVIYTTHKITSIEFLVDDNLIYEREKPYPIISDGYKYFGTNYKEIEQDYIELEKYQKELNEEESSSKLLYQAQKLAPDEDMEFALWRKTTFHYLNVRPMESQQAMVWNYINSCIRKDALKKLSNYSMQTGVLTLDENRITKTPIKGKISSPDIWLKVIDNFVISKDPGKAQVGYDGIAIIMNTNYGNPAADTYFDKICTKNWCEKSLSEKFPEQVAKTVGCCPVTNEILEFFDSTQIFLNLLKIDGLTDENASMEEEQRPLKKIKLE